MASSICTCDIVLLSVVVVTSEQILVILKDGKSLYFLIPIIDNNHMFYRLSSLKTALSHSSRNQTWNDFIKMVQSYNNRL